MKETLDIYRRSHNALITLAEKEPCGDHKAWLNRVIESIRKDLILVENMIDEKKPPREVNKVFNRIDLVFNRIK